MARWVVAVAVLAGACNVRLSDLPPETDDAGTDSAVPVDAPAPDALVLGAWGPAAMVTGASAANRAEDDGTLSSTTLELVFAVEDAVNGGKDLYYTSRTSVMGAWTVPVPLGFNTVGPSEETPRFSADDLTLYFASSRVAANGLDIYMVTRSAVGSAWSTPALVAGPNTTANEKWLTPCGGGRYLVIRGGDIAAGTIGGAAATIVGELSAPAPANETGTFLTQDCLTAYFASPRSGPNRIYTSTRTSVGTPWSTPTIVGDFLAIGGDQEDPWLAPDQRTFMLASNVSGTKDVYISTR